MKRLAVVLAALSVATSASAAVVFTNLGTSAPPATLGPFTVTPFDQVAQAAIANFTDVSAIPGSPLGGTVATSIPVSKRTVGAGWGTWSHGYTGAVYYTNGAQAVTLTVPAGAGAFNLYAEPNPFSYFDITVTTNDGGTSGPISVTGSSGANGFGFHTTAGEEITSVTISCNGADFAFGEFGIAGAAAASADVSIAKTVEPAVVADGTTVTYTIVVANAGPSEASGVTVADAFPAGLTSPSWTCSALGGATCTAGPVAGDISDTVDLPSGSSVTYVVTAVVSTGGVGSIENLASVTLPGGVSDPDSADHASTATLQVTNPIPALGGRGVAVLALLLALAGLWVVRRPM